jgi:hypothetical protein
MAAGDERRVLIEVFSAGCATCKEGIEEVEKLAAESDFAEIRVHDMHQPHVARRAKELGVRSVPAVAITTTGGVEEAEATTRLAACCQNRGIDFGVVRDAVLERQQE